MATSDPRPLRLRAAMHTDIGVVRERNEDSAYVDAELQLYLLADGLGGHAAGDVASSMAVDLVRQRVEAQREALVAFALAPSDEQRVQIKAALVAAVRDAHRALRQRGLREPDKFRMGTTLEVALVVGRDVFIAHVGDSRIYLVRRGLGSQITRDHTMAQVMVMAGTLTPEEAETSPLAAVVVNAVGIAPEVTVDVVHLELRDGDRLLLCSDGLYEYFTRDELAERLTRGAPHQRVAELVELARSRGGHDNITGIVVEVTETGLPRTRRLVAEGSSPPPPSEPTGDPWEEETTLPRTPPELPPPVPRNPLSAVTDDALNGFVEYSLYEESRPHSLPH
jgi:serine/threonine protein phosphatase PrpC